MLTAKHPQVMISEESLTVSLEEAIENQLLRSGNPATSAGDDGESFWATVRHVLFSSCIVNGVLAML